MLDSHGHLAIAVLIFYALSLPIAIYVLVKQGAGRHLGWFYLCSLNLVRIIGAAVLIAAETASKPSIGLYITAAILNSVGLAPLLLTLLGLLKRVNDGMSSSRLTPRVFQLTHLATIVGLALAIAGGVESDPTNSPSTQSSGLTLRKAGAILFLVSFLSQSLISLLSLLRIRNVWSGDRRLVYAAVAAIPFLLVRTVYLQLVSFDNKSRMFSSFAPDVYVQAFMQISMEMVVFILFVGAGSVSPSLKGAVDARETHARGHGAELFGGFGRAAPKPSDEMEMGRIPAASRH